jgi:hypothetical protein
MLEHLQGVCMADTFSEWDDFDDSQDSSDPTQHKSQPEVVPGRSISREEFDRMFPISFEKAFEEYT